MRLREWLRFRRIFVVFVVGFRGGWWSGELEIGYEAVGFFGELEAFDVGDAGGFGGGEIDYDELFVGGILLIVFWLSRWRREWGRRGRRGFWSRW